MTEQATPIANLLVLVERHWIDKAFDAIKSGAETLAFGTRAKIKQAGTLPVRHVFFKPTKYNGAVARADFLWLTTINPRHLRLPGFEDSTSWEFYYGFSNLTPIEKPIPTTSFYNFNTGTQLRNDVRSSCLVTDPQLEPFLAAA